MNSVKRYTTQFTITEDKAYKIGVVLLDHFYNRKGFFKDYEMPEYILPRNMIKGSREHALYLTYVISIDHMTNAVKLWKRSREEFTLNPNNFNPTTILDMSDM